MTRADANAGPRRTKNERPRPLWTRSPTPRRAPLSREAIVTCAISLADSQGLDAVSIRTLATELGARPMSIYTYAQIERKKELFDLMVDAVCGEMLLDQLPRPWRDALRATALRCRDALIRHPWWTELVGRNVLTGPNGTRYREQTLAAIAGLKIDRTRKLAIILAVERYVVGQATYAIDEHGASRTPARTHEQWRQAADEHRTVQIETAEFPHLTALGPLHPTPDDQERYFTLGLDWLLDGISTDLKRQRSTTRNGQRH